MTEVFIFNFCFYPFWIVPYDSNQVYLMPSLRKFTKCLMHFRCFKFTKCLMHFLSHFSNFFQLISCVRCVLLLLSSALRNSLTRPIILFLENWTITWNIDSTKVWRIIVLYNFCFDFESNKSSYCPSVSNAIFHFVNFVRCSLGIANLTISICLPLKSEFLFVSLQDARGFDALQRVCVGASR